MKKLSEINEKDIQKIFKELDKLDLLARKSQLQDQKVNHVMEKIFGDEMLLKITNHTELWEDDIFSYYSNAEGHDYKTFKERFSSLLNDALHESKDDNNVKEESNGSN